MIANGRAWRPILQECPALRPGFLFLIKRCIVRWPLRNQILLPFAGVTVVTLVVVSVLNALLASRRTESQVAQQLYDVAETLRPSSFPLTETVLKQARGLSGAELVVLDDEGSVIAASLPTPEKLSISPTHAGHEATKSLGKTVEFMNEQYFHREVELRPRPGSTASLRLHVLYPERILQENLRQAIIPPLVVGGIALVVVVLASLTLAHRLSRPIAQLRSQVGRIAEGDFQPLPLPPRDDELHDLVESVNRMTQKLTQLTQSLQRTERFALLGQLGGGLAHHLRNDITGAKMAVQLHQRSCPGNDPQSLTVALRQLALTEEHLQHFLTIGQPRAPRQVDCDLRQIMAELLNMIEPTARHRKIELKRDAENAPLPLRADPDLLRQMFLNLVLNAIDAAGPGGWVRVEATADRTARLLRVKVSDSGPGPPAEIREKLFEPFVTGKPEGIGLGLAAAHQIAETHGGRIVLLPTNPTCFEVTLPGNFPEEPHDQHP